VIGNEEVNLADKAMEVTKELLSADSHRSRCFELLL
jgi:hypothetical protein